MTLSLPFVQFRIARPTDKLAEIERENLCANMNHFCAILSYLRAIFTPLCAITPSFRAKIYNLRAILKIFIKNHI